MLDFNISVVFAHVILGTVAVGAGVMALAARKGARVHVGAGRVFVVTMGLSSLFGAALGLVRFETLFITFHAGVLGATLVVSGVLAVRIRLQVARRWYGVVALVNGLNAAGLLAAGAYALSSPDGVLFSFPAADYLFLFTMAAVVLIGDLVVLLREATTRKHRVAQHLSRMCTGFFIAAGSAFTGPGAKAFPEAVQASGVLSLPELIIVVMMLFWLFRTLRSKRVAA